VLLLTGAALGAAPPAFTCSRGSRSLLLPAQAGLIIKAFSKAGLMLVKLVAKYALRSSAARG
jgi:hypothetical protein